MQLFALVSPSLCQPRGSPFFCLLVRNSYRKMVSRRKGYMRKTAGNKTTKFRGLTATFWSETPPSRWQRGKHLSLFPFPPPSISLVSLVVLVLHPGSFGHLIVDLTSCIRKRCFLASEHSVLLSAGDNAYVGLCSLCVPTFCATSAFLSMTGCRKGLFGPVLAPFWMWGRQGGPAQPHRAKNACKRRNVAK